jgi:hypothetical protein
MTLATQKSLPDVLLSIEMKLNALGWVTSERVEGKRLVTLHEPRVMKWAIASCIKSGVSESFLTGLLEKTPPDRQWRAVRTHLPESALHVLDGKLDAFLLSDGH